MESSILKAQVARDRLQNDFLDRIDGLSNDVRQLQIGTVQSRGSALDILPGTMVVGDKPKLTADAAGNLRIGSDLSGPGGTHFSIFSKEGAYNGETFGEGDLLIGDNSANKANIWWDKSSGYLFFRGGQTYTLYINTAGALEAGGGAVVLNENGMLIGSNVNDVVIPDDPGNAARFGLSDTITLTQLVSSYAELRGGDDSENRFQIMVAKSMFGVTYSGSFGMEFYWDTGGDQYISLAGADVHLTSITQSTAIGCRARRTSARSLSWDTWYNMTPQSDSGSGCFDNDAMWQSGWDYIKINTAGVYAVGGHWGAGQYNNTGLIQFSLEINSTVIGSHVRNKPEWESVTVSTVAYFAAGDKFYFKYKRGGGSGTITTDVKSAMWATRIP